MYGYAKLNYKIQLNHIWTLDSVLLFYKYKRKVKKFLPSKFFLNKKQTSSFNQTKGWVGAERGANQKR